MSFISFEESIDNNNYRY